jgi:hypothetical protein
VFIVLLSSLVIGFDVTKSVLIGHNTFKYVEIQQVPSSPVFFPEFRECYARCHNAQLRRANAAWIRKLPGDVW